MDPLKRLLVVGSMIGTLTAAWAQPSTPVTPPASAKSEADLMAARKARAANPNRPTIWWPPLSVKADAWFRTDEAREIAERILSWQDHGTGWPLMNTTRERFDGDATKAGPWGLRAGLIKATGNEMRFLARAHRTTGDERYRGAVLGGLNFILAAQHPTGGWPHSFPLRTTDYTHQATYNDDEMSDLMKLLREVSSAPEFELVGAENRKRAGDAQRRGVDFILKSQIKAGGKLTAWAQQHDEVTYEPRPARAFEPVAISGGESAGVLELLMSLPDPSPDVVRAIEAGVQWYHDTQIDGIEVVTVDGDRIVRPNKSAPPLWARFYEIGTNKPFFMGRDGVPRTNLAEVERERRTGYAWYNQNGTRVFERHAEWKRNRP